MRECKEGEFALGMRLSVLIHYRYDYTFTVTPFDLFSKSDT